MPCIKRDTSKKEETEWEEEKWKEEEGKHTLWLIHYAYKPSCHSWERRYNKEREKTVIK